MSPGALPLLSTALLELWRRRDGRRLRQAAYEHTGGVRGAVARLAEEAYGQLDPAQQAVARSTLVRLAVEGAGGAVERRRVPLAELDTEHSDDVARVIELFTDQRLLTVSAGSVEVAHEALLREWPRLRGWIQEDREGMRIHARPDRRGGGMGRGSPATTARCSGAPSRPRPATGAPSGIRRSTSSSGSSSTPATPQTGRAPRPPAALRIAFAACSPRWRRSRRSPSSPSIRDARRRQRDIAVSRELAATATNALDSDPATGLALALRALDTARTDEAEVVLRQATLQMQTLAILRGHEGRVTRASFAPDGRRAVSAGTDGTVRIWDLGRTRPVRTISGHDGTVYQAVFSPDGRRIASAGEDGTVAVMDGQGRGRRIVLQVKDAGIRDVDFSPDGQRIAAGAEDGNIYLARADGSGQPGF